MHKSIKLKEKFLSTLDSLLVMIIVLLDLSTLALIIIFIDISLNSNEEIAVSIIMFILFLLPLIIVFYLLSKILFSVFFQKEDKSDIFPINRAEFPELYETIDEVRSICKCPKIHVIALDYSNNAYIKESSIFHLSKWKKRYLVIGVPLLLLLNEKEFKGVLAHECAHLSKLHSRSTYRISQKIKNFRKYLDKLKKKGKSNSIASKLIKKYIILLNNLYFQLRKNHELEADSVASKVVSKQALITALIKMTFYEGIFDTHFEDTITDLNKKNATVLEDIYFLMEKLMKGTLKIPEQVYKSFLEHIRNYYALPGSTHPSIAERAEALGATIPSLDGSFNGDLISIFSSDYESAIRTLFKNEANTILHTMSIKWAKFSKDRWDEYYKYILDLNTSLQDITAIEKEKGLDHKQWIEQGFMIEELAGINASFKIFKDAEKVDKENFLAKFHIARILLLKGNAEGVEMFNSIMENDAQLIPNCCYHLINYYLYENNRAEAVKYYTYAVDFMNTNKEVLDERFNIYISDEFLLNDLSSTTLEKIRFELAKHNDIKKAYVVIKKLNLSKDFPLYIIGIKYNKFCSNRKITSIQKKIIKAINNEEILPWDFQIVPLTRSNIILEYNVDSLLGARII